MKRSTFRKYVEDQRAALCGQKIEAIAQREYGKAWGIACGVAAFDSLLEQSQ